MPIEFLSINDETWEFHIQPRTGLVPASVSVHGQLLGTTEASTTISGVVIPNDEYPYMSPKGRQEMVQEGITLALFAILLAVIIKSPVVLLLFPVWPLLMVINRQGLEAQEKQVLLFLKRALITDTAQESALDAYWTWSARRWAGRKKKKKE
jgi:hypothetical protein